LSLEISELIKKRKSVVTSYISCILLKKIVKNIKKKKRLPIAQPAKRRDKKPKAKKRNKGCV